MTRPVSGNLFGETADSARESKETHAAGERIDRLVEQAGLTLERIVSRAHASPPGFWYDSPRAEWVVLLSGAAGLEFEGDAQAFTMQPGDYVAIPAHCRHRVAWTHDSEPSVWLALHYPDTES